MNGKTDAEIIGALPLQQRLFALDLDWRNKLLYLLFFFFPILTATVRHVGSTLYALLTLLSLFYFRKGMKVLSSQEKRFLLGFAVFFFLSFLSLLMTEDLRVGVQRLERYARFLVIIPIYCMLRGRTIETGKVFLAGSLVAVFAMLAQGLYQINVLNAFHANGAYNKIIMGNFSVLFSVFLFISFLFYRNKWKYSMLAIPGVYAGLYVGLLSGCRTAWLFLPMITVYLLILYRKRLSKKNWQIFILGLVISSMLMGVAQSERLKLGFKGLSDSAAAAFTSEVPSGTVGERLVMWRNSFLIFKDSPIFGTGMGDFKHDSIILLEKGLSYKNDFAVHSTNAHNIYFMLLAEGGLFGLTLLVFVLFVLPYRFVYGLWKKTSDKSVHFYALLAMISLVAFAWFGVSESWVNRNTIINAYCITLLVFIASAANRASAIGEISLK